MALEHNENAVNSTESSQEVNDLVVGLSKLVLNGTTTIEEVTEKLKIQCSKYGVGWLYTHLPSTISSVLPHDIVDLLSTFLKPRKMQIINTNESTSKVVHNPLLYAINPKNEQGKKAPFSDISISFFVQVNGYAAYETVLSTEDASRSQNYGWGFRWRRENMFYFTIGGHGYGAGAAAETHRNIVKNKWYHILGTFDGKNYTIYLDGKRQNTIQVREKHEYPQHQKPWSKETGFTSTNGMSVGCLATGGERFHGCISNIMIFDKVIQDENDIMQLIMYGTDIVEKRFVKGLSDRIVISWDGVTCMQNKKHSIKMNARMIEDQNDDLLTMLS